MLAPFKRGAGQALPHDQPLRCLGELSTRPLFDNARVHKPQPALVGGRVCLLMSGGLSEFAECFFYHQSQSRLAIGNCSIVSLTTP